jgi:hypothetical protein
VVEQLRQSLDLHRASEIRKMEIHATETLVSHPSSFEVENATGQWKQEKILPDIHTRKLHLDSYTVASSVKSITGPI